MFGLTERNLSGSKPASLLRLPEVEFTSGEPLVIKTDEQWKVSDKEILGWNRVDFDDSGRVAVKWLGLAGTKAWGHVRTAEDRRLPARWLRKEFTNHKSIKRATVYYAGPLTGGR